MPSLSLQRLAVPAAIISLAAIILSDPNAGWQGESTSAAAVAESDPTEAGGEDAKAREVNALRTDYKEKLIQHLIDGNVTLEAVAEEFLTMNRESPATLVTIRGMYPDVSDEEAAALNVINYLLQRSRTIANAKAVQARVGREYREKFGHDAECFPQLTAN